MYILKTNHVMYCNGSNIVFILACQGSAITYNNKNSTLPILRITIIIVPIYIIVFYLLVV